MSIEHHLERAFWTPVIVADMPDHARIAPELEATILARYEEAPGLPADGGWQSDLKLLEWGGPAALAVRDAAIELAEMHTADTREGREGEKRGWASMAWANICGDGTYNRPHVHGDAYWTAVYYVRVDPGEGGELVLHDPRLPALEMHAPRLRFRPNGGEGAINTAPEAGMLLLFPGWLSHSIAPYSGGGLRISMAMNLAARFGPAVELDPTVRRTA